MNIIRSITIVTLLTIPMLSLAGPKLWERNMIKKQAAKPEPMLIEGAASKMNHNAVEHKRFILGERYPETAVKKSGTSTAKQLVIHTNHMGVHHKREKLGENYIN